METPDKWSKLEEVVRRVVREELDRKKKTVRKITITLNGKGFEGITDDQIQVWKRAYPLVDIGQHLSIAAAWCKSNETKAPKSDYARFLNKWFLRQHNEASGKAIPKNDPGQVTCAKCHKPASSLIQTREGRLCVQCRG